MIDFAALSDQRESGKTLAADLIPRRARFLAT